MKEQEEKQEGDMRSDHGAMQVVKARDIQHGKPCIPDTKIRRRKGFGLRAGLIFGNSINHPPLYGIVWVERGQESVPSAGWNLADILH